jgi:hypothetical protein
MDTHKTADNRCPTCDHLLNLASNLEGENKPKDGDFSLCIGCGEILRFGHGLTIYKPGSKELQEQDAELLHQLLKAKLVVRMMISSKQN